MSPDNPSYRLVFSLGATLLLLLLLLFAQRVLSPKHTLRRDLEEGNFARALLHGGDVFGVFLIAASISTGSVEEQHWRSDALWVAAFGVCALALFLASSRLGVRVLLRSRLAEEVAKGNAAAGIAAGAHSVAVGLLVSHAVAGSDLRSLGLSLVFFVLAQVTLHLMVVLFRALTTYDDAEEILQGNVAAALSYAGVTVGVALVIARAVEGTFTGWVPSLISYGSALVWGVGLYVVRQFIVQAMFLGTFRLRGGPLDVEIARDRNVGMGAIEALAYVATALVVLRVA